MHYLSRQKFTTPNGVLKDMSLQSEGKKKQLDNHDHVINQGIRNNSLCIMR